MRILLCLLGLGWAGALAAEDQRFTFALPEEEGRISLGVFDDKGALVRTLAVAAEVEDFSIGLNGLMATWNGENDQGERAPAGKYFVRGFVVGDSVKTEGVAYHFNDWVEDGEGQRVTWIENFQLLPDGSLILAAASSYGLSRPPVIIRYRPGQGILWKTVPANPSTRPRITPMGPVSLSSSSERPVTFVPLVPNLLPFGEAQRRPLAADQDTTVTAVGPELYLFASETGRQTGSERAQSAPPRCFALEKDALWVGAMGGISKLGLPGLAQKQVVVAPEAFDAVILTGGNLIGGVSGATGVWRKADKGWEHLELPLTAGSLAAGTDQTFWVAGHNPAEDTWQVGQFAADGEFHSSYRGDLPTVVVSAAGSQVGVLEENETRQRLLILERKKDTSDQPWEIVFEKNIQRSTQFEVEPDGLKAEGSGKPLPEVVKVVVSGHGLDSATREVSLNLQCFWGEIWLSTSSGLRILPVTEAEGRDLRLALRKDKGSLTVYAGDGAVVEEFVIRDLESQLAPIDAGEIDLP